MKAIPTTYKGVHYRSKLEAQWAKLLDNYSITHYYEPQGVEFPDGTMYLPDFYLPGFECWLEVKGFMVQKDLNKIVSLVRYSKIPVIVAELGSFYAYVPADGTPRKISGEVYLAKCTNCRRWSILSRKGDTCLNCGFAKYDVTISSDYISKFWDKLTQIDYRGVK